MRKILTFLFTLITLAGFSQGITVTVGEITGPTGPTGITGPTGVTGVTGPTGVSGNVSDSLKAGVTDSLLINTNALIVRTTGQVGVGIGLPDASSLLDITSITQGFLYPRMTTTQRDAIGSPATGLSIYNTTNSDPNFFNGSAWRRITHAPGTSLKVGEVIFSTGVSALMGDSVNFFWDNTSKRLAIGMAAPTEKLEVNGNVKNDTSKIDVLKLNGISADSIIPASSFTGNLGNSTTRADTLFSSVMDASGNVTIGGDLAITGDVSTVQWTDYGGTSTIVGWSGTPTANIWYKKVGNIVFVMFAISGTSNSTSATFSLPYASFNGTGARITVSGRGMDNGSWLLNPAMIYMEPNLSVLTVYKDLGANGWTASGNKQVHGQFWFESVP